MKAEQNGRVDRENYRKKLRRVLDSVYVFFLTLLLVSQLHYEKRIQKFVLRNEEELTEFTKNYLAVEQRERRHMFEEWKEENGYSVQLTGLFPENVVAFYMGGFGLAPSSCVLWILLFTRRYSGWNRGRSACKSRGRQCGLELAGIRRQWRRDSKNKTALVLL